MPQLCCWETVLVKFFPLFNLVVGSIMPSCGGWFFLNVLSLLHLLPPPPQSARTYIPTPSLSLCSQIFCGISSLVSLLHCFPRFFPRSLASLFFLLDNDKLEPDHTVFLSLSPSLGSLIYVIVM